MLAMSLSSGLDHPFFLLVRRSSSSTLGCVLPGWIALGAAEMRTLSVAASAQTSIFSPYWLLSASGAR